MKLRLIVCYFTKPRRPDLIRLAHELRVDEMNLQMPRQRAKSGFRQDKSDYYEVLSNSDCQLIERLCSREIERLGYCFI